MKKKLVAFAAMVCAVLIGFSTLAGCKLTTTDNVRDMAQVVAEINIGNEGQTTDKVYKKDLVLAYLSYGYLYSYYYGYTSSEVYESIVDSLVGSRVLVQYVKGYYETAENGIVDSSKAKWDVERYLTADEIVEAKYNAVLSVNNAIDGYMTASETASSDTLADTVRTVPTGATNAADPELTVNQMQEKINEGIFDIGIGEERHTAYNKFISIFSKSGVLTDYNAKDGLLKSTYFKELVVEQEEQMLVNKYSEDFQKAERDKITYETLSAKYKEMYDAQKQSYDAGNGTTDFESALSSATSDSPIVYSPYSGYGYVYNLLLGVSDEQEADIEAIKATDNTAIKLERNQILSATTVKDLRSTWILSGYDCEFDETNGTVKFTGDYTFNSDISLAFQGTVNRVAEKDEENDTAAEYSIESVKTFGLDEFVSFMDEYVFGSVQTGESNVNPDYYKKVQHTKVDNYEDKINELLFAFSTDPGSLNTYKGYVVNPLPDVDLTESFVKTFADASRELMSMGGSSYIIAASDYGYHVIFYSAEINTNINYPTLDDYLDSLDSTKGGFASWSEYLNDILTNWEDYEDSDFYLYKLASVFNGASDAYTKKQNEIVKAAKADESKVKIYSDRYADLG